MTSYLVCEAGLPLMAGYNHSQEYLERKLNLEPFVRQAFIRCTPKIFARLRRNAFFTIKKLKRFFNSNTQLF